MMMHRLAFLVAALAAGATSAIAADGLPLKDGFYVRSEATCAAAGEATLLMLDRHGLGGAQDFCRFTTIVPKGAGTFEVAQHCYPVADPSAGEDSTATYILKGDAAFTVKSTLGWEYSAAHCPQSSLPEPYRSVDLSQ